ncbi:unnamed protein product [Linum trigynum]|uniref:Fe2OG dioxygenase domain-containing protein n=1 Tax=Linum trigynum TaxID=586398 RepID=A0AAV2EZI3_9ROSI
MAGSINEAPASDLKLPFIDFSRPGNLKQGTPYWDSLKSQVREALEDYGCFEASFDRVPSRLRTDVFGSLEDLFDLPLPTKQASFPPEAFPQGYLGRPPANPFFESFGLNDPHLLDVVQNFSDRLWPQGDNPSFSKNIHSMSKKVSELDQIVRTMILESFGLEKYVDEHMCFTNYHLRVMKYEVTVATFETALDPKTGLKVHTDKSMITTLCQNEVDGLELQNKRGEWVKFKPTSRSSFVVLVGDSLYAWLNGRVHCPDHRVWLCENDKLRYSFALFTRPKANNTIKAPEELIDEQHPLLFKPFTYKQLIASTFTQARLKEASPLLNSFSIQKRYLS